MQKRKRDILTDEMRSRLTSNRLGRLTAHQWLTITLDPVVTLLLLLSPAIVVFAWRLPILLSRGMLLILIGSVVVAAMLALRARRYARMPLHYRVLYAAGGALTGWQFWRAPAFYDDTGRVYRFTRWLAPSAGLIPDHAYMVYYLEDGRSRVLCSLCPLTHVDAEKLQPSVEFHRRMEKRRASTPANS
jgi:hypothetical protein